VRALSSKLELAMRAREEATAAERAAALAESAKQLRAIQLGGITLLRRAHLVGRRGG
jgi:hypothetical protein